MPVHAAGVYHSNEATTTAWPVDVPRRALKLQSHGQRKVPASDVKGVAYTLCEVARKRLHLGPPPAWMQGATTAGPVDGALHPGNASPPCITARTR